MINREGGKTVIKLPKATDADTAAPSAPDDVPAGPQTDVEADTLPVAAQPNDAPANDDAHGDTTRKDAAHGPFMPLLLVTVASLAWMGYQSWLLYTDRQALQAAHVGQQQTVDNAVKLRASLDTLAADTQRLAEAGNGNARLLVDELRKRGVTINSVAAQPGK